MEKKPTPKEHIYLELPNMNHKEFLKLVEELKKKGARYDETLKKWHIRPSLKDQFQDYLPVPGEKKFPKVPKGPNENSLYLNFPKNEGFEKTRKYFREMGAEFDWKKRQWYIQPELKERFKDYLPNSHTYEIRPDDHAEKEKNSNVAKSHNNSENITERKPQTPKRPNEQSIYLNFPYNEGFERTRKRFREMGAEFDWEKRQWYIQPELKERFKDYLPDTHTHDIRPDNYVDKKQSTGLAKSPTDNAENIKEIKPKDSKGPNKDSLYLNFPHCWSDEMFERTKKRFKEKGAKFDSKKRKWYIQPELKEQFKDYLFYSYSYDINHLCIIRPDNYVNKELNIDDPDLYIYDLYSDKFVDKEQIKNDPDFIEYFNKEKEALKARQQEDSEINGQEASTDGEQTFYSIDAEQENISIQTLSSPNQKPNSKMIQDQDECGKKIKDLVDVRYQEIKADIESHKYQATPDIVNKFTELNHLTGKKIDFNQFYTAFKEGTYKGAAGQLIRELGEEFYKQRQPQRRTPISRAIAACNQIPVR